MQALKAAFAALVILAPAAVKAATADSVDGPRAERFAAQQTAYPHAWADVSRFVRKAMAMVPSGATAGNLGAVADKPVVWASGSPPPLWDGAGFPQMIVVPPGEFTMGSPANEPNRRADEGPLHRVRIGYAMAVGKYPVTVAVFALFIATTGYDPGKTCKTFENGGWQVREGRDWRNPGFAQTPDDPVVCLNWIDAQAYVAWLAKATGHPYRLLSEAEYEYVNRAGAETPYWWGAEVGGNHANCNACGNGVDHAATIPVGSFAPNAFGLFDTTGNAWSWVSDCLQAGYAGAPVDGGPYLGGECEAHVLRGGAWYYVPGNLRAAIRTKDETTLRNYHNGVRVAFTLSGGRD